MIRTTKNILKQIYKPRKKESKKYDFGLLLIIGGSEFYSGPPALAALSAFRAGVDMVQIIAPKRPADIIASFSPNLAAYPLDGNYLEMKHLDTLLSFTESARLSAHGKVSVLIGGGLGRTESVQSTIIEYLSKISIPTIIDADAIHAVAKKIDVIKGKNFLITPHRYEFFMLTGRDLMEKPNKEKIKIVKEEAARLQTTILLKGDLDIISDGKRIAVSKSGNPYLTKGGTGDTLAGIAGSIMARGFDPFIVGQAAAYINGRAGEIASKKKRDGLLATDLIELIPQSIFSDCK